MLFIVFGLWTLYSAVGSFRAEPGVVNSPFLSTDLGVGLSGWLIPDGLVVLGLVPESFLLGVLATLLVLAIGGLALRRTNSNR